MARAKAIKILLVDDDEVVRESLAFCLQQEGYQVTEAQDGLEALEKIKLSHYHIVILDLKMPDIDGIKVLQKINDIDTDTNVIILTGHPSLESAVGTMKLGAVDYCTKPFNIEDIKRLVREIAIKKGLIRRKLEDLLIIIGKKIRETRKSKRMTLVQLARMTDLSKSLISQIENAKVSPSVSTLDKISESLDIKLTDLFDNES
ncbi:MAG TPA: response regulator [Candidatus Eremiobacteraeota bacterium]|nr:response regulator [Candidatus Eremiobacteraeota bacterium]